MFLRKYRTLSWWVLAFWKLFQQVLHNINSQRKSIDYFTELSKLQNVLSQDTYNSSPFISYVYFNVKVRIVCNQT